MLQPAVTLSVAFALVMTGCGGGEAADSRPGGAAGSRPGKAADSRPDARVIGKRVKAQMERAEYETTGPPESTLCSATLNPRVFVCRLEYSEPVGGLLTPKSEIQELTIKVSDDGTQYDQGDGLGLYDFDKEVLAIK